MWKKQRVSLYVLELVGLRKGEKNSSYFFSLEKQRQAKKKIQKLHLNGVSIENQDQVNEEIRFFL